jgi:hypothetical protein
MPQPVFETGLPRPQRGVLTTILLRPGDMGYRSPHLSHAKRALYHLSYIPRCQILTKSRTYNVDNHSFHHIFRFTQ